MINEQLKVTGDVLLKVVGKDGAVKEVREIKNLVVTTGRNFIASRMAGTTSGVMSHLAIGTSSTAAALTDTALGAEAGRIALSGTSPSNNTVQYTATVPAGTGTGAIVEAGLFNAASAGTMLCRTVFPVINKGASDSLSATWTITVS